MPPAPSYSYTPVPLGQLDFDPQNPRLPPSVDGSNDAAVFEWMLSDTGLLELMGSIARQGYFPGDSLLIAPWEETDQPALDAEARYRVVEGNRRLAAVRLLVQPDLAPRRKRSIDALSELADKEALEEIPSVIFGRRDDILDYLGFRHITGVKEWDPLEKARYLKQLRARAIASHQPHENSDLARVIGSKGPYVGRLLAGLEALERLAETAVFREAGVVIDDVPFSLLTTALNYDGIAFNFLGLERADDPELRGVRDDALGKLGEWLFLRRDDGRTALGESRNMRVLNEVVQNERAIAALDGGAPIREAALLAHRPDEVLLSALRATEGPLSVADEQADDLEEASPAIIELAQSVSGKAGDVARKVSSKAPQDSQS